MKTDHAYLPEQVFDELVDVLLEHYGEDWITDKAANQAFTRGTVSILRDTDGVHLIGEPESEHQSHNFNLWIDFPVEDVLDADELAFSLFANLAEEIFISTRVFEEKGVRYRFVTGTAENGHLGSLNFTGPHAIDFVNLHKLRLERGTLYHA